MLKLRHGCETFGPKRIWSLEIWSHKIDTQLIGPYGQTVPNQFGPHGQMVPKTFRFSRGTGCGDPEIQGLNWLGTICSGGLN